MPVFIWIFASGLLMSTIALIGSVTCFSRKRHSVVCFRRSRRSRLARCSAAHEVPQELGDFPCWCMGDGGWGKREALWFNVLSALTFLLGGIVTYIVSFRVDIAFLVPFAAGNFVYIAASDLVPEVNKHRDLKTNILHFLSFTAGIALLYVMRVTFGHD